MKLLLTIQEGALAGQQFELQEGVLLLGRSNDCQLRFHSDQDQSISAHHALIRLDSGGFRLIDQKSTNGTLLNGAFIEDALLRPGDLIQLSKNGPRIRVALADAALPAAPTIRQSLINVGIYDPQKTNQSHYLATAVALSIAGALLFLVTILFVSTLGFFGTLVGALIAFAPCPIYLFLLLWMDRYDPEPPWILACAFAWGGLFAILISFIVNTLFGSVVATVAGEAAGNTLSAVISAPLIEEMNKGAGLLLIFLFLRKEFDGVVDGLMYAGIIGLGFATVENILYYGAGFTKAGFGGLLVLGVLRGVLSPFIHSFFTAMTGIGFGIARESHNRTIQYVMPLVGFGAAVTLHSLWNLSASMNEEFFFLTYLFIWIPLFFLFLLLIFLMAWRERRIIRRHLSSEVGELLTTQELQLASSLGKRIAWLMGAIGSGKKFTARRRFLSAVTKLAFCYWHVDRAMAAQQETISFQQIPRFRAEITALKSAI